MQHCKQAIYVTDNHCADCGEQLKEKRTLKTALELKPDLLTDLRKYHPKAYVITGKITSMHYYKRKYSDKESNLFYGYWWLTLEDREGCVHQLSVDSEAKYLKSLVKGDVLSLIITEPYQLNHPIANNNDKKIVCNNTFAPLVVAHKTDSQYSAIHKSVSPKDKKTAIMWLLVFLGVFFGAIFGSNLKLEVVAGIAITLSVLTFIWELTHAKKLQKIDQARYETTKQEIDSLLHITYKQLGYDWYTRAQQKNDIFCTGCNKRISNSVEYCYWCGDKKVIATKSMATADSEEQVKSGDIINNVAQLELQLMQEYSFEYSSKYTHKNVLVSNDKGTIHHECTLAKVVDKIQHVDVDHSVTSYSNTTRTDTYQRGIFQKSEYDTTYTHYESRSSSLTGLLILETADYSILKLTVSENMLASVDVGDWYFYATSLVEMKDSQDNYLEYAHNVTKDIVYKGESVTKYGYVSNEILVFILFIAATICTFVFDEKDYIPLLKTVPLPEFVLRSITDITYAPLALFGVFMGITIIWSSLHWLTNTVKQKRSVAKLRKKIATFKKDFNTIKQKISQLG